MDLSCLDSDLPEELMLDLCDMSYALVLARLPKRVQREVMVTSDPVERKTTARFGMRLF